MPLDEELSVIRTLERLITAAEDTIETQEKTRIRRRQPSTHGRLLRGLPLRDVSRPSKWIHFALLSGVIALAAWGCGFLSLVFKGEDQQAIQETEACDEISSDPCLAASHAGRVSDR